MNTYHIRKIVVPVDLSETSLNAIDTAVAIARRHDASLVLLNVIEKGFDLLHEDVPVNDPLKSADVLNALVSAIDHTTEVKPTLVQQDGHVRETIVKQAFLYHCDLIIMGTHGASGYRDGFVGSNTYNVIKNAGCPVLTIPPKRKFPSFKRALFPIRPVIGALQRYDVVGHFLSANAVMDVLGLSYRLVEKESNVLDKIIDEIEDKLMLNGTRARASWNKGMVIADDVLQSAIENNSDLIVVTSALDVTTKPNFIGPHSQKIINCSKIPVLNIKKVSVPTLA